ncbi:hypothetical protein T492DRAFT_871126 [Pavlovales sp. CCMP2436]|nr:hypothetical protein T492DRAFT_871126 [Pavlovales sp. CCMP2436]
MPQTSLIGCRGGRRWALLFGALEGAIRRHLTRRSLRASPAPHSFPSDERAALMLDYHKAHASDVTTRLGQAVLGACTGAYDTATNGTKTKKMRTPSLIASTAYVLGTSAPGLVALRFALLALGLAVFNLGGACCVGCGRTRKLRACSKCLTAKFCGAKCIQCMWPVHKQNCKTFAAAREEAAAAADGGADEHGSAPAAV